MTKEFKFKKEINKIPINSREKQIIKLIEEKFDEFIKKLKEDLRDIKDPEIIAKWGRNVNERLAILKYVSEWLKIKESEIDKILG